MNTEIFILGLICLVLLWSVIHYLRSRWILYINKSVFELFSLAPQEYRLIGTDIGNRKKPLYLRKGILSGVPDAAFISKDRQTGLIGEYKSRTRPGRPSLYERYQLTLYMGMLKQRFGLRSVAGVIRYHNAPLEVPFDQALYDQLISLEEEASKSKRKGMPVDVRPLHTR